MKKGKTKLLLKWNSVLLLQFPSMCEWKYSVQTMMLENEQQIFSVSNDVRVTAVVSDAPLMDPFLADTFVPLPWASAD